MRNRDMMAKLQQVQAQIARAQAEMQTKQVEGSAGGGAVKVVVNGGMKVESLVIDRDVIDPEDAEMLQDLIIAAMNEALEGVSKLQMQQASGLAGMMGLGL